MTVDQAPPSVLHDTLAANGGTPVVPDGGFIPPIAVKLDDDEINAAVDVLRSGRLRQGDECSAFEQEFAQASDAQYCLTTSNGTTALQLAYQALFEPGDEVLCPGYTFMATASMIIARGAIPVFCEIDPATFNLDPLDAAKRITSKTKAIAAVHLYGNPCDITALQDLANQHGLAVIYDAAQSHLAEYQGKGIGAFGDAVTYSFYPTKNMTTGEGGMLSVNDKQHYERLFRIRDHGMVPGKRYEHIELGFNFRLHDVAATIGRCQLQKLPLRTDRRLEIAKQYHSGLSDCSQLICPTSTPNTKHVFHQYAIRLQLDHLNCDRDTFVEYLRCEGIGCAVHYPTALTEQVVIQSLCTDVPLLPKCIQTSREVICLPIHHALTDAEVTQIVESILKVANATKK